MKLMKKKPKKGAKPDAKPQTKLEPVESFFNFFSPPEVGPVGASGKGVQGPRGSRRGGAHARPAPACPHPEPDLIHAFVS
jgi:hypothetical protein